LVDVAKNAAEDFVDLLAAQIKLARLELTEDLRKGLQRLALVVVFIPVVLVGYAFAMAALASWLAAYWGTPAALAAVGGLQIVVGGAGVAWALARLRRTHILQRSTLEAADSVQRTIAAVSTSPNLSGTKPSSRRPDAG
jgi:uncharacterized membrane protein YqjE